MSVSRLQNNQRQNIKLAIESAIEKTPRVLLAISGPPAAGKSTLAEELALSYGEKAVVVPMDGFHLDNDILTARGMLARKGAPETFDGEGFVHLVQRIAARESVYAPRFDRAADLSRAGAIEIDHHSLIIFEGNYLFSTLAPWDRLISYWTISIWLDVSMETIEKRCIDRWLAQGLSLAAARTRARENDLVNARLVIESQQAATGPFFRLSSEDSSPVEK